MEYLKTIAVDLLGNLCMYVCMYDHEVISMRMKGVCLMANSQ